MPRVTLQCNRSFVLHFPEIFVFYKSKILALLQTLIKASQLHQKSKKLISRTCEKSVRWKLVGLLRMLPVTFQGNPTQISRCKKKLFFWQITTFAPKLQCGGVYMLKKSENYRFFEHVKKVFNNNWGVGRDRLYLVSSVVWARELISARICFFHKTAKWLLFPLINVHIGFRLKS